MPAIDYLVAGWIPLFLEAAKINGLKKYFPGKNILLLFLLLCFAIYRDIRLIKQFPADLRNRVVGARLTDDGKPPYFYKWKKGDNTRYIDYNNTGGVKLSNMTASPFMHQLMIPLSHFPQQTISVIWLVLEYFFLLIIIASGWLLCRTGLQQLLVINAGILFTWSEAWINHIYVGQYYLLIAAISALSALLLIRYKSMASEVIAGLLTTTLIFIRPVYIVFLIPFLFYFPSKRTFLVSTILSSIIFIVFILFSPWQKFIWMEYKSGIDEHIKMHQGDGMMFGKDESLPYIRYFEGYDMEEVKRQTSNSNYIKHSENGNAFVVYNIITKNKLSLLALNISCLLLIMLLYWRYDQLTTKHRFNTMKAVMFGLALYLIMEIFLPIHRHQYNTVQYLPLIILFFSATTNFKHISFFLCATGLLLNITNTSLIPLRHTIGEVFILFAILLTVYNRTKVIANGP